MPYCQLSLEVRETISPMRFLQNRADSDCLAAESHCVDDQ